MAARACLTCGRSFTPRTYQQRRCEAHEARGRSSRSPTTRAQDPEYHRNRAALLANDPPCVYCGQPATQADHIVPVALGGTHHAANLAPACAHCNASKKDRPAPAAQVHTAEPGGLQITG